MSADPQSVVAMPPDAQAAALRARLLAVIGQHQRGELPAAIAGYAEVLALQPRQFDALRLLGAALRAQGRHAEAVEQFDRAIAVRGDFPEVWLLRGESLAMIDRLADAEASVARATQLRPDNAAAWAALGQRRHALSRYVEARDAYERSLALEARLAAVWSNRGLTLDAMGRPAAALESYDRALACDPAIAEIWCNRAKVATDLGRAGEALENLQQALALVPDMAAAWSSRATPLRALARLDEALQTCARALQIDPALGPAWAQRGATLAELGRYAEAADSFEQALALDPADNLARFNRSLLQLTLGQFKQGWDGYEVREGMAAITARYPAPVWDGKSSLAGRVIAVHCEQGLGDTLQFCRYAPLLVERGARVLLTVPTMLQRLLGSLGDGVQVLTDGDTMPAFDLQCLLLSLPHRLGTVVETIPARVPYLAAPAQRLAHWRERLGLEGPAVARRRIGLVCSGSAAGGALRHRSVPLAELVPLIRSLGASGIEWHLLQKDLRAEDAGLLAEIDIVDHRDALVDFSETAALAACMDVVVSVDTAVAHLAGALGVPLFVLLHAHADWRWLLERADSPWYPSARLLRQETLGDWGAPIARLAQALQGLVAPIAEAAAAQTAAVQAPAVQVSEVHVSKELPAAAMPAAAVMVQRVGELLPPSPLLAPVDLRAARPPARAVVADWRDDARLQQLQESARQAPGDASAQFNLGLRYLALGRFDPGWDCYEWRQQVPRLFTPMPEGGAFWDGSQDLAGKTLLLCHEQGLGDVIQFCRFVPSLARHGARILLGVPPPLARLMGSLDGVAQVISGAEAVPAFDLKCLLMSAAQRLAVTPARLTARLPYLAAPADRRAAWATLLQSAHRPFRIGIACSGNAAHAGDAWRSLPLERLAAALAPLFAGAPAPGVELHLVQDSLRPVDMPALSANGIIDHRHRLTDMAETAALLENLDAIVSVDTSVAHLAGALGVPLYLLLPEAADWRWMLERDDSPWYPSARLLRCCGQTGWDAPLERLPVALAALLRARGPRNARRPGASAASDAAATDAGAAYPVLPVRRSAVAPPDLGAILAAASRHHRAGERGRAIAGYRSVIAHDPLVFDAQRLLGAALFQDNEPAQALPVLEQALALRADSDEVWALHGNCLGLLGRPEEAIESLERARALRPEKAETWNALGRQLQALGRWDAADAHYDRAVALDPARPEYRLNRALVCLQIGDFAAGWTDWDARLVVPGIAPDLVVPSPQWDGSAPLAGKTLLLVCEQGLGDSIQFARYAPPLGARGACVVLGVPPPLRRIIGSLGGGVTVVSDGEPLPAIDYTFPLMSLARVAGTRADSIPWNGPYLRAPADRIAQWAARLASDGARRRRYGLVFSGNADHGSDAQRSIRLEQFAPLLRGAPGRACAWHLLQKEVRAGDEPWLQRLGVIDHRAELVDLAETAALAANLDGVIAVDTAVAHLAGALGLPLYLLLAFNPDWRWLLERSDTPWYPSAQLLRQAVRGDWSEPLRQLGPLIFPD